MIISVDGNRYQFSYYPFFRMEQKDDFHVYGMRLPSGKIEDVLVFDMVRPLNSLREYAEFLIREYVLEEDDMLTPRAMDLKRELQELLGHEENR